MTFHTYYRSLIYFHCATQGQKLDAIRHCGKASFCVVARDDVRPEKLTTLYRSVIAFGCVRVAEGEEKRAALETLGRRYAPGLAQEVSRSVQESWNRVCALVLEIEHITGKEGRELAIERGEQA